MASEVSPPAGYPRGRAAAVQAEAPRDPLRLAFVGVGWIGRMRMSEVLKTGLAEAAVILDPSHDAARQVLEIAPRAERVHTLSEVLEADVEGVVIATPNQMHVEQAIAALEAGLPVFCQKPLARTAGEVKRVMDVARERDLLVGVDLSYRAAAAIRAVRDEIDSGALGDIFSVDVVFHNAYGPDKAWCRDPQLSGGGCVLDLGIHIADLALWLLGYPAVNAVDSRLWAGGRRLGKDPSDVEDYATFMLDLATGVTVNGACSWNVHAGRDCMIGVTVHGTKGAAAMRNVNGSFFDFVGERYDGCVTETLTEPPDAWSGRIMTEWVERVHQGSGFDPERARQYETVARVLDEVYGR